MTGMAPPVSLCHVLPKRGSTLHSVSFLPIGRNIVVRLCTLSIMAYSSVDWLELLVLPLLCHQFGRK